MIRLASFIICLVAALLACGARAADITVTNTADSGPGSLRQAIADASAGQEIDFAAGLSGQTITLTSGELVITNSLTITGLGADQLAVSGNNNSRIFAFVGSVTNQISGLTLTGGNGAGTAPTSRGGAILNQGGTLLVSKCVLSGNSSLIFGGAIFLSPDSLTAVTVDQSTISGNSSLNGGGIFVSTFSSLTVSQSTFFNNNATQKGGAIFIEVEVVSVAHSTLAGNSAANGGAVFNDGGILDLSHTILANSVGTDNYEDLLPGVLNSLGYNLSDDNSAAAYLTGTGDLNNTPAGLDPSGLQDNGGPTPTISLLLNSAAIDAGDPGFSPPPNDDQRGAGFPRVFNGRIDIGAFESQGESLILSHQDITVHYHDENAPGATDTNRAYTLAEIEGTVRFEDPSQFSDDILSSLAANQVSVHVKAVLGGQTIADTTLVLAVTGGRRENWESAKGLTGPVETLKIHWENALKFTSKNSNPTSPKIESRFIGLDTTDLRYEIKPGSYTTTLPHGVVVTVAAGKITGISGLAPGTFEIADDKKRADLTLPYRLVPGMVFATAGTINDTITVTAGTNYMTVEAKYQLKLVPRTLATVLLFNAIPDTLQYEITLGTGPGEDPVFGSFLIGTGSNPWDSNVDNHKKFKDD